MNALSECGEAGKRRSRLHRAACYLKRLSDAFAIHQCSLLACACAYCAVLSLIPLLVVAVAIFGYFVGDSQRVIAQTALAIRGYVPVDVGFLKEMLKHVFESKRMTGFLGLIGLLYAAHQTFLAMLPAMNIIWSVPENRHWVRQRLIAIGATLATLVLLGADLITSGVFAYLQSRPEALFSNHTVSLLIRLSILLLPMLLTTLLFALLYRVLPATEVTPAAACIGAGVAALLWQLMKIGFSFFLIYSHSYDRLYGSISGLIVVVVWIYYSMAVLLLGAEVAADNQSVRHGFRAAEERAHSGADLLAARGTVEPTTGTPLAAPKENPEPE